jgi:hypothetical protein
LLPHFLAAANDLMDDIKGDQPVDLDDAYQGVALNAVLRALFSLPDRKDRDRVGNVVRQYITGPGRPQVLDGLARTETAFSFALGGRRAFQKRWTALVDSIVADRRRVAPGDAPREVIGPHRVVQVDC